MLDPYGRPMLMDFGVARVQVEGNLTKTGTVLGTPHYLPPEQPLGKPVDARSDIYSLGIMFYEMLSGQLPFHDENAVAVLFKHINEPPQPLNTLVADINPELAALCHRMIEKDPVKRPQSAGEVAEVLHALSAIYPAPTPIAVRKSTPGLSDNTEQLILLAREHVDQNKLDKALEIYTVVIQRNPQNTSAKMEISKILRVMFTRIQDHASKQEFDKAQNLISSIKPMVHDNDRFENLRAMVDLEERLWAEKQGTMTAMDSEEVERMIDLEKARMEERKSVDIPPPPPVSQSIEAQPSISKTMIQTKPPLFRLAVLIGIGLVLIGATLFLFRPKAQTISDDNQSINLLRRLVQLKKPEQPPAQVLGQLSVTSEPAGATVFFGEEKKGVTPLQLSDLAIGKYSVQVKLQGYEDFKQEVELTNEQSKLDLPVALKAIDPTQIKGSVRISSVPDGADVYLDGKVIGKTPFRWKNATPGDQSLLFKKDGYEDRSVTVSVIGNKTTSFETQLAEIPKVAAPVAPVEKPIAPGTLVELGEPGVQPPKVVKRNTAEFSAAMKQLKREGTVKLNILVSENGKVLDVKVLESPHPVLEQAAIKLVKEWTYNPATKNGVPVRVWFPAAINFKKGTG
jgi:TonB family protein